MGANLQRYRPDLISRGLLSITPARWPANLALAGKRALNSAPNAPRAWLAVRVGFSEKNT